MASNKSPLDTLKAGFDDSRECHKFSMVGGSILNVDYDYFTLTYVASGFGAGEIETITYYSGGSGGTAVMTVTLTYDSNNKLASVSRS